MRKMNGDGRFPVESIGRAILNSWPVNVVTAKVRDFLEQTEVERLRTLCIVLMVSMFLGDLVLLGQIGRTRTALHYSAIHVPTAAGAGRRQPAVKAFGLVWDSLMAEPATKERWDSLLQLRPGLRDTIRQLEKMDSAISGR